MGSSKPQRADRLPAFFVFCLVFGVYAFTACRTIYSGDSGDFLVAVARGGVPHPSGYPLFLILARLFGTLFPVGEWAFRVNLFVALTGAVAALFVYLFLDLLLEDKPVRRPAAALGALCFAFGPATWGQATISEVYSLGLAFLAALLFYALRWVRTPEDGTGTADNRLAGLCLLYGFALTNHLTIAFVFPPLLALVIWHKPSLFGKNARLLLPMIGLLLLPLSLYAYLPFMAHTGDSPVQWGTPDTGERFLSHVAGRRYSAYMFPGREFFLYSAGEYFGTWLKNEFGAWLVLAPIGFFALVREARTRAFGWLLLGIEVVQTLYGMNYATPDVTAYYLPTYLVIACFVGAGAAATVTFLTRRLPEESRGRSLRIAGMVLCLLPLLPFTAHYAEADKSNDYRERAYGLNMLRSCPPNAVLIMAQDAVFTLWYEQYVRGVRPDVVVVQYSLFKGADLGYWYGDSLRRAYPDAASLLPAPNTPSGGEPGLIRFAEQAMRENRPVLVASDAHSFPLPRRLQLVTQLRKQQNAGASASTAPAPARKPAPANPSPIPVDFNEWLNSRTQPVPYGLCTRLYPRFLSGEAAPALSLGKVVRENAAIWATFDLDGIFIDSWRSDPDPLHYSLAAQYLMAVLEYGKIAEQAGMTETARDCYQKAATIYPAPDAVAGLKRLEKR